MTVRRGTEGVVPYSDQAMNSASRCLNPGSDKKIFLFPKGSGPALGPNQAPIN